MNTLKLACLLSSLILCSASFAHPGNDHTHPGTLPELPVITGNGQHTYQTVPQWGALPDGQILGPTHGSVAVSKEGRIYVSTEGERGICVFSEDGKFIRSIAPDCSGTHSLTLREENGVEYLYGAHRRGERIIKLTLDGTLVLQILHTEEKAIPGKLQGLTAVTVAPDGRIFAAVGYGSNMIHIFDANGTLEKSFGSKGDGIEEFQACHGIAIDPRFDEPRLLVADRENLRLKHYDLDGNFIGIHSQDLRRPCAVSFYGEYCAVAELAGRVTILNKNGTPVAFLGDNPRKEQWAKFRTPLEEIPEGVFTAPHGLSYDSQGNLYIQDWNQSGRITKLRKL